MIGNIAYNLFTTLNLRVWYNLKIIFDVYTRNSSRQINDLF